MSDKGDNLPLCSPDQPALIASYTEVCSSHRAIDDFRMKLLGILPIASVIGLFSLDKAGITANGAGTLAELQPNEVALWVGFFAAAFTLALFIYEIQNILTCHDLIVRGTELERLLNVSGQFHVCDEQRSTIAYNAKWQFRLAKHLNAKLAASAIYSLIFAAWLFVALRYGLGRHIYTCAGYAVVLGFLLAVCSYSLLHTLVTPNAAVSRRTADKVEPAAA